MAGLFITVEGIDGAGKSTHLEWMRAYFAKQGRTVVLTREPGGTPLGEALRALLLESEHRIDPEAEALLMFAARREHIERVIRPALEAGSVVICDRFTDATFAYQGGGRGVSFARLDALEQWVQGDLQPHLTLFFDVPVAVGRERIARDRKPDRFEREQADFFERVRAAYLQRAQRFPGRFRTIDSSLAISQVKEKLETLLVSI